MMELEEAFEGHEKFYLTYCSLRTRELPNAVLLHNPAEKATSFILGVFRILLTLIKERPDVVISTGAEIAAPTFLIAKLLGMKTIYIESCARRYSPSGTGKLVYPLSDYFFVQWKELLGSYGRRARYEGGLL
jgi:UDP-N-acetylglucosamine:LPS N-acetylglucosamine transferase